MNKQVIALIGVLVALSGGLATGLVSCFNHQQDIIKEDRETIKMMNDLYIKQSKEYQEEVSALHSGYNAKIIDLIIKGQ